MQHYEEAQVSPKLTLYLCQTEGCDEGRTLTINPAES